MKKRINRFFSVAVTLTVLLVTSLLVASIGCNRKTTDISPDTASFIKWARQNAIPIETIEPNSGFDDLAPFKEIVGTAKIVCLGESRHDIHQQFRFKHRLVEFLVTEMGFRTFILEEGLPYARKIDRYIRTGDGNPADLLAGMPMWYIWDTGEMLELIKWMRNFNADPNHKTKLRFFGMDVTSPKQGMHTVLSYLKRIAPGFTNQIEKRPMGFDHIDDNNWSATMQRFGALAGGDKKRIFESYDVVVRHLKNRRQEFIAATSVEEYRWALRLAESARGGIRTFSAPTHVKAGLNRDVAMTENVKWIIHRTMPGEGVIIWAHNAHIGKEKTYMPDRFGREGLVSMGSYLKKEYGNDMVTIAALFNRGEFDAAGPFGARTFTPNGPEHLDGALARVGLNCFLLDLRKLPAHSSAARWTKQERPMHSQGGDLHCRPAHTFDAVYFIDTVSRAQLSAKSRSRFNNQKNQKK